MPIPLNQLQNFGINTGQSLPIDFPQGGGYGLSNTGGDWFSQNAPTQQGAPVAGAQAGGSFTSSSTYYDLVKALNAANAAPGSPQFDQIVQQYTGALGLTGGPGNGFNWGQYDPGRTKIYVPGADLRYMNTVNGQQVAGWQAHPTGGDSGSGGMGFGGSPTDIMTQDPGYQFRLGQGMDAIQKNAAARGTLLTGGTLKGLQRYAQDYASGEFGGVFGRNLSLAQLGKPS